MDDDNTTSGNADGASTTANLPDDDDGRGRDVDVVDVLTEVLTDILVRDPVEVFRYDASPPAVEKL